MYNFTLVHIINGFLSIDHSTYGVSQKNFSLRCSQHFPIGWEFLRKIYTPVVCSYLRQITEFYSTILKLDNSRNNCSTGMTVVDSWVITLARIIIT